MCQEIALEGSKAMAQDVFYQLQVRVKVEKVGWRESKEKAPHLLGLVISIFNL